MAQTQNISYYRGEDVDITVTMTPPENITGWEIQFTMRQTLDVLPILITKTTSGGGITLLDLINGVFRIHINSADTKDLLAGAYQFDIQRTNAGNATVLTVGAFTLLHAVRNIS